MQRCYAAQRTESSRHTGSHRHGILNVERGFFAGAEIGGVVASDDGRNTSVSGVLVQEGNHTTTAKHRERSALEQGRRMIACVAARTSTDIGCEELREVRREVIALLERAHRDG